jgi:DNA-binding transcriptional ArsR family regulator
MTETDQAVWSGDDSPWLDEEGNPFDVQPPPLTEGGTIAPADEKAEAERPTLVDHLKRHLMTTADLDSIPDPVPIVGDGILFEDTTNWLIGKPKHGKSFVAIDLAGCIATGRDWHGNQVRQGRVLYLAAEGVRGVRKRVRAWEAEHGVAMTGVDFLPFPVQATNDAHWSALVQTASDHRYAFIVVDTQARVTVGIEENSNREMGAFVHQAERLRLAAGACVLLVHHVSAHNGDRGRGASTMDGALWTIMRAEKDENVVKLANLANKDAPEWPTIEFTLHPVGDSVVLRATPAVPLALMGGPPPEAMTCAVRWWEAFADEWQSGKAIMEATNTTSSTLGRHRQALGRFGLIESELVGRWPRYRLTRDPREPQQSIEERDDE